jgi:hypothetical protein
LKPAPQPVVSEKLHGNGLEVLFADLLAMARSTGGSRELRCDVNEIHPFTDKQIEAATNFRIGVSQVSSLQSFCRKTRRPLKGGVQQFPIYLPTCDPY